jgi:hypothetical protein
MLQRLVTAGIIVGAVMTLAGRLAPLLRRRTSPTSSGPTRSPDRARRTGQCED